MDYFGFNKPKSAHLVLDVSGDHSQATITNEVEIKGNIINVNKHAEVTLDIPICKGLAPNLDVQMFTHYTVGESKLAGYTSLNIADQLQKFYVVNNIPLAKPSTSLEAKNARAEDAIIGLGSIHGKEEKKDDKEKDKDKDKKKDKDAKKEPTKSVLTNEGLSKEISQGQNLKYINTFRINENIEFDASLKEIDADIDLDEIVLDNKADENKGFVEDKDEKGVKSKMKKARKKVLDGLFGSGEEKIVYEDFVIMITAITLGHN